MALIHVTDNTTNQPVNLKATSNALNVNLGTALSSSIDSIDVAKMTKGTVTVAHNAITSTTTSSEIDCRGFNSILLSFDIDDPTKAWNLEIQGSMTSGATKKSVYDSLGTQFILSGQKTAGIWTFKGCPEYIVVVATEVDNGATVTVKVQPFNM